MISLRQKTNWNHCGKFLRLGQIAVLAGLLALTACAPIPAKKPAPPPAAPTPAATPHWQPVSWNALPDWQQDDLATLLPALRKNCQATARQPQWQPLCSALPAEGSVPDWAALRQMLTEQLQPYQLINPDNSTEGLITGYYEPLLHGQRSRSKHYRYPVYGVPSDLLTIDLTSVYPELKGMRLRGRLDGNKVIPYYDRADIEAGKAPLGNKVLAWVDDPVALFFLQVQGSGQIELPDGSRMRVGYADQNGYPYQSIGRILVERGELPLEKASMQGIRDWGKKHPDKLPELLNSNPSYVFFRELPTNGDGPIGSLGVPLTATRSVAVDPRAIPLGTPLYLVTTWPNSNRPIEQFMLAQDTGGAIKGTVRADFFWGFGDAAGALAGAMRSKGQIWILWPKNQPPLFPPLPPANGSPTASAANPA